MRKPDPSEFLATFLKALDATAPEKVTVKFATQFLKAQARRMGLEWWEVLKTPAFYERVMREQIRLFYENKTDVFGFLSRMFDLIADQFRRAFNEGLRSVGFDSQRMTPDMAIQLEGRTQMEMSYLLDFAQELETARNMGQPVEPFYVRIALWTNRYGELRDLGAFLGGVHDDLYIWKLGATERHCATCGPLAGTVATKREWEASGYHPRQAPNPRLECGGWRCDCTLEPTTEHEPTPGGIPVL